MFETIRTKKTYYEVGFYGRRRAWVPLYSFVDKDDAEHEAQTLNCLLPEKETRKKSKSKRKPHWQ